MDYVEKIRTDKGDLPVRASAIREGTPIPGLEGVGEDVAKLKTDTAELIGNVDMITATQKEQGRILSALWDLNEGKTYRFEEDSTPAYSKTMPSGARMTDINMIGGKTIVWNQMWVSKNSTSGGITKTTNTDGYSVFNGTPTGTNTSLGSSINAIVGHKYYTKVTGSGVTKCQSIKGAYNVIRDNSEQYPGQGMVKECTDNSYSSNYIQIYYGDDVVFDNDTFYGTIIDLTQMFGAGNEPTAEEFESMFPADYYPYSEPTLISADVDKVVVRGSNIFDVVNPVQKKDTAGEITKNYDGSFHIEANGSNCWAEYVVNVVPNKKYRITRGEMVSSGAGTSQSFSVCYVWDSEDKSGVQLLNATSFSYLSGAKFFTPTGNKVRVRISLSGGSGGAVMDVYKPMIIETDNSTVSVLDLYMPYHTPIAIPIPESIRNLPGYGWSAGVIYNEVDFVNKKYIQRVGKEYFDQSRTFRLLGDSGTYIGFYCNIVGDIFSGKSSPGVAISDIFGNDVSRNSGFLGFSVQGSNKTMAIYIDRDWLSKYGYSSEKTSSEKVSSFNLWFADVGGLNVYYKLETPIITDISDILDSIDVEAGGTLTFENTHGDDFRIPVPNTTETVVKLSEVTA